MVKKCSDNIPGCQTCRVQEICIECLSGYYKEESSCKKCHSTCLTCGGPTENNCLTCDALSATNGKYHLKQNACIDSCPSNCFEETNICKECHESCLTCSGAFDNNCLTCNTADPLKGKFLPSQSMCLALCPSYTYEENNSCKKCNDSCSTCFGQEKNNCLTCNSSSPVYGKFNFKDNTCISTCPSGTYEEYNICKSCLNNCLTCNSNGSCSVCERDFFLFEEKSEGNLKKCIKCEFETGCFPNNITYIKYNPYGTGKIFCFFNKNFF